MAGVVVQELSGAEEGAAHTAAAPEPLIEIGWVAATSLRATRELAEHVEAAAARVQEELSAAFDHYRFRCVAVQRVLPLAGGQRECIDLIELGAAEREERHWDFACVVSEEDLRPHTKPMVLGAPASSLNVCALSLARLRSASLVNRGGRDDSATLVERVVSLFLHLFGHLNDLAHEEDPASYMFAIRTSQDLDRSNRYSERAMVALDLELAKEADPRVEEEPLERGVIRFYLEAVWRNRRDIVQSVLKARPWTLVFRLAKLATTAASTLIVTMLAEESWRVGTALSPWQLVFGGLLSVLLTTAYVLQRHGLFGLAGRNSPTEQRVAATVSVALTITLGMATTYALLFLLGFGLAQVALPPTLLTDWVNHDVTVRNYVAMAGFVATLGVVIGALGASFEEGRYFRHTAIIDEET
jgi:predicted Zn-dependent protease